MHILLVTATPFEIQPLVDYLKLGKFPRHDQTYQWGRLQVSICVSGLGGTVTAFNFTEALQKFKPDFCLQVGVAGSFDLSRQLTSIVAVKQETFGDLGVDDRGQYQDFFETGLLQPNEFPFQNKNLVNDTAAFPFGVHLPWVHSLSVQTVSGSEALVALRRGLFNCDIENMEGAAFHYICLMKQIPFLQVRAISNYVKPRNRNNWQMPQAIQSLHEWLLQALQQVE
ncbi:MAG: futalosine hydrolase [Edaphocola sp.]